MLEYVRLEIILSLNQLSINLFWQNSLLVLDQNSLLGLVSSHLAMFGTARILLSKFESFGVGSSSCSFLLMNFARSTNCRKCSSAQVNALPAKNCPPLPASPFSILRSP